MPFRARDAARFKGGSTVPRVPVTDGYQHPQAEDIKRRQLRIAENPDRPRGSRGRSYADLSRARPGLSDIEPEVHHVTVADDVIPSLKPHLPRFARALLAPAGDVVFEGDHLGA